MIRGFRARWAWRLFRLRTDLLLGGAPRPVRRQVLEDLSAHFRDLLSHDDRPVGDYERVRAALARIGDPREFIPPLLADAVPLASPRGRGRSFALARVVARFFRLAAATLSTGLFGAALLLLSVNSFLHPGRAGVFRIAEDEVQVRLFGLSEAAGAPVFAPWLNIVPGVIGIVLLVLAWRQLRRLLSEFPAIPAGTGTSARETGR